MITISFWCCSRFTFFKSCSMLRGVANPFLSRGKQQPTSINKEDKMFQRIFFFHFVFIPSRYLPFVDAVKHAQKLLSFRVLFKMLTSANYVSRSNVLWKTVRTGKPKVFNLFFSLVRFTVEITFCFSPRRNPLRILNKCR